MSEMTTCGRYENLEQPPTPEQLALLTSTAIAVAKKQRKFREGRNYRNAHFLHINPVEVVGMSELDDTEFHAFEHKLSGHIRRLPITRESPLRSWSLRLGESIWTTHNDASETQGLRTYYVFEWNEEKTTRALRRIGHVPMTDTRDLYALIDNFAVADDASSMLEAELAMEAVTAADCRILHEDIVAFCAESQSLSVA